MNELELGDDLASVTNLLDFLEKVFNGGSDFNEPVKRCLDRLHDAAWANSDVLLVRSSNPMTRALCLYPQDLRTRCQPHSHPHPKIR